MQQGLYLGEEKRKESRPKPSLRPAVTLNGGRVYLIQTV